MKHSIIVVLVILASIALFSVVFDIEWESIPLFGDSMGTARGVICLILVILPIPCLSPALVVVSLRAPPELACHLAS